MRKSILYLGSVIFLLSCSARDFLTRRLATDLLAASEDFKVQQHFVLQMGLLSNKDYATPEHLVLQHHGWISATTAPCTPGLIPPPCWEVTLTPRGVDTIHAITAAGQAAKSSLSLPIARRELLGVTGISKQGNSADVEFLWKWVPLNEVGAALYSGDVRYKSIVEFRQYDDGWRIAQSTPHTNQTSERRSRMPILSHDRTESAAVVAPSSFSNWITGRRIRAHAILLAVCFWGVCAVDFATPGLFDRAGNIKFQDFLQFYISARLIREHRTSELFNQKVADDELRGIVGQSTAARLPMVYGPQVGLLFVPFAQLSFAAAARVWVALSLLMYFCCVYAVWRACATVRDHPRSSIICAIAFPPLFHFLFAGRSLCCCSYS